VEIRETVETADPAQTGHGIADLNAAFTLTRWEAGRLAVYRAMENAPEGRPFLDGIEVQLARPLREQSIDLETGRADVVELGPNELRRPAPGRKTWTSSPVRLVALVFGQRVDVRVREALALAIDRAAIHTVLLQRQGEITGALLPQWLSGYAFVFPSVADVTRARSLTANLPASSRAFSLRFDDASWQTAAARIALNAREAGLTISIAPQNAAADVRLVELRIASVDPARALAEVAAGLGFAQPALLASPEELLAAERLLLEGFRTVPLFHLPDVYGASPRVKGGPGISPLGEWRFEHLWVEAARP